MNESLLSADQSDELQLDPSKSYYEELVGEGKKFKDQEALARKAIFADHHISKVEKENEEVSQAYLRVMEESKTQATLKSLIERLETQQHTSTAQPEGKDDTQPTYDPKMLDSLLDRKITEREIARQQKENFDKVKDRLTQRFGNNYHSQVKQQISDLGITEDEFNDLARTRPNLLIKTLDLDVQPRMENQSPPRNSSTSFRPQGKPERRWSYYKPLFKANPKDRNLLIQMDRDAQEQGEAFFDVD